MREQNPPSKNTMLQQVADKLNRLFRHPSESKPELVAPPPVSGETVHSSVVRRRNERAFSAEALRGYVMAHLGDSSLDVAQWAESLGCSRTSLYAAVREAFDVTPLEYITQCRLQRAIVLLSMGTKASAVARQCGFDDPKYFGKLFKKRYGMLPSRYFASLGSTADDGVRALVHN